MSLEISVNNSCSDKQIMKYYVQDTPGNRILNKLRHVFIVIQGVDLSNSIIYSMQSCDRYI